MTSCEQYREWISAMLDGELSDDRQKELNAHLGSCPECRAMVEAFYKLSALISEGQEEPPEALRKNIMEEIRNQPVRRLQKTRRILSVALAAAACAALVITVSPVFRGDSCDSAEATEEELLIPDTAGDCVTEECEEAPAEEVVREMVKEESETAASNAENDISRVILDNTLTTAQDMHCRSVILIEGELPFSPEEAGSEYLEADSAPYIIRISSELAEELMNTGLYEYSENFSSENDICLVLYTPCE